MLRRTNIAFISNAKISERAKTNFALFAYQLAAIHLRLGLTGAIAGGAVGMHFFLTNLFLETNAPSAYQQLFNTNYPSVAESTMYGAILGVLTPVIVAGIFRDGVSDSCLEGKRVLQQFWAKRTAKMQSKETKGLKWQA